MMRGVSPSLKTPSSTLIRRKKIMDKKIDTKLKEIFNTALQREKLGLNPICPACGRVMKTKRKDKYSGEYYCICKPDLILCMG
jgi:lysyl-tRNA synthetase class I